MLSVLAFSTSAVAASAEPVVKKSTEISTFGIKLGQPVTDLNVLKVETMGERYSVEPSHPIEFFDSYNVTTTPEYNVYKVFASGEIKNSTYTCNEAAAFLSKEFEKTYDTSLFKPLSPKVGQYIYMSKDVSVSIMCIGQNLGYTFAYQKDLSSYPVPIDKFKEFNIKI
jgi:hypothetical protein